MKRYVLVLLSLIQLFLPAYGSAACTVCHSKRPEMREMHKALGYKDCFSCHGPTARSIDLAKRNTDPRCAPCHTADRPAGQKPTH